MRSGGHSLVAAALSVALAAYSAGASAQVALAGKVSSAEEGAMEGVLVSAKKAGSTITITVVSDAKGRYSFPAAKLDPGRYAIRIRAVGYDLAGPGAVDIAAQAATVGVRPEQGPTLREMIIENLLLERQQVATYTTLVRELGERDPTTRRLLVEILADTERHASELADYLKSTSEVRP